MTAPEAVSLSSVPAEVLDVVLACSVARQRAWEVLVAAVDAGTVTMDQAEELAAMIAAVPVSNGAARRLLAWQIDHRRQAAARPHREAVAG